MKFKAKHFACPLLTDTPKQVRLFPSYRTVPTIQVSSLIDSADYDSSDEQVKVSQGCKTTQLTRKHKHVCKLSIRFCYVR